MWKLILKNAFVSFSLLQCSYPTGQGRVSLKVAQTKALSGIKKPSSHSPVKDVEELSSYTLWEHTVGRQNGATTLENSLAVF